MALEASPLGVLRVGQTVNLNGIWFRVKAVGAGYKTIHLRRLKPEHVDELKLRLKHAGISPGHEVPSAPSVAARPAGPASP